MRLLRRLTIACGLLLGAQFDNVMATNCVPPPAGLVSWWRGEGDALDQLGGNHGTLNSGSYVPGKVGLAFAFDGSTTFASFPASSSLNVGTGPGLTFECWIKPGDLTRGQVLAEWNDGAGHAGVHLWISIAGLGGLGSIFANVTDINGASHYFATAASVLSVNSFQHVALTYDKATGDAKLFLNGAVVVAQNLGVFTPQTSYGLYLGKRISASGTGSLYAGLLDEPSLYNRALILIRFQDETKSGKVPAWQDHAGLIHCS